MSDEANVIPLDPTMVEPFICNATKRDGKQCTREALPGLTTCAAHRPDALIRSRAAAQLGGERASALRTAKAQAKAKAAATVREGLERPPDLRTVDGRWRALEIAFAVAVGGGKDAAKVALAIKGLVAEATALRADVEREEEHQRLVARAEQKFAELTTSGRRRFPIVDGLAETAQCREVLTDATEDEGE